MKYLRFYCVPATAFLLGLSTVCTYAQAIPEGKPPSQSQVEVQKVVDEFRAALINKDKQALDGLFQPTGVSWVQVLSDAIYEKTRLRDASAKQVSPGSEEQFSQFIAGEKHKTEERFANLTIRADGAVASVYFDYTFLLDDKVSNRGQETWQLVRGTQGWKICAVAYSITSVGSE